MCWPSGIAELIKGHWRVILKTILTYLKIIYKLYEYHFSYTFFFSFGILEGKALTHSWATLKTFGFIFFQTRMLKRHHNWACLCGGNRFPQKCALFSPHYKIICSEFFQDFNARASVNSYISPVYTLLIEVLRELSTAGIICSHPIIEY